MTPPLGEIVYRLGMIEPVSRRLLLALAGATALPSLSGCGETSPTARSTTPKSSSDLALKVFKDPSCGCCGGWVKHAEDNGFSIKIEHPKSLGVIFDKYDVGVDLRSCHLATHAAGAVIVGHVPARFVIDYLKNPPAKSRGLSVPDMPVGTPGMEMGDQFEPYQVMLLQHDGSTKVFAKVTSASDQVG